MALAVPTQAHDTEVITSLGVLTNSGWVIDADGEPGNPSAGRDKLWVSSSVEYGSTSPSLAVFKYRLNYKLKDSDGNAHPIYDENGKVDTAFRINETVGIMGTGKQSRSNTIPLKPASRLSPGKTYQVELTVDQAERLDSEIYKPTGAQRADAPRTYYHFTNRSGRDTPLNAIAAIDDAAYTRTYLIDMADSGKDSFQVQISFTVRRYDEFSSVAPGESLIPVHVTATLTDASTGAAVPLQSSSRMLAFAMVPACDRTGAIPKPTITSFTGFAQFRPGSAYQLDSVNKRYRLTLTIRHDDKSDEGPAWVEGNSLPMAPQQFLHFNGTLNFGAVETIFDSIANDPSDNGTGTPGSFVGTRLAVRNQSGFLLNSDAFYTYGDGTLLDVKLLPNGNAELRSGTVTLTGTSTEAAEIAGIRFRRLPPIRLSPSGGKCDLRLYLPAGLGCATNSEAPVLDDWLPFDSAILGAGLLPSAPLTYTKNLFYCKDTLPLRIETSQTVWDPVQGSITLTPAGSPTYVRALEHLLLSRADLVDESMREKASNEQVFAFAQSGGDAPIIVRADPNGSARWSIQLGIAPGRFTPHFPIGPAISWNQQSHAAISSDRFVPADSFLAGAGDVGLSYSRGCDTPKCDGVQNNATLALRPTTGILAFTPDGGLWASGAITAGGQIAWGALPDGRFAHRTTAFQNGSFHMPGSTLRGDASSLEDFHAASVLLFSGVDPSSRSITERPFNAAYANGRADYAGINLRATNQAVSATTLLAADASVGPYKLEENSKYYVRQSGISGVHQARTADTQVTVPLYGYMLRLDTLGLAFLDNQNIGSRTSGALAVRDPAGFVLPLDEMLLTCMGDLSTPKLASSAGTNHLDYWNADFIPHMADFRRSPGAECEPGKGTLVVSLTTWGSHVSQPLHGTFGFKGDGNILTPSESDIEGVQSRLQLPNTVSFAGPENTSYRLRTSGMAYFNNHDDAPADQEFGWLNLYGTLDLPYFQDMPVHMQTSARRNDSQAPIYLMGGWTESGGRTFDLGADFDPRHRGYPTNVTLSAYRNPQSPADQQYRPRAKQRLLQIVPLEYPLAWDAGTRIFRSSEVVHNPLLLLDVKHQVKYLSGQHAEVAFGAQYSGLPRINLANLAFNALPDGVGVASILSGVIGEQAHKRLTHGFERLDRIVGEQLDGLFDAPLALVFDPALDGLESALRARHARLQPGEDWFPIADEIIDGHVIGTGSQAVFSPLGQQLRSVLIPPAGQPSLLASQLQQDLAEAIAALDALAGPPSAGNQYPLFGSGPGGARDPMRNVARELIRVLAPSQYAEGLNETLGHLVRRDEPAIAQVVTSIMSHRAELNRVLNSLNSDLAAELSATAGAAGAEFDSVVDGIRAELQRAIRDANYQVSSPFQEFSSEDLKSQWRQRMKQRFMASSIPSRVQRILRSRFYDLDSAIHQTVDSGFGQINRAMEDALSSSLATLDRHLEPFVGSLSSVMSGGQIDGYARFVDDSVPELRLDGKFQWRVPDALEFRGFLLIKQKSSEGDGGTCYAGGANVTEVTVGAEDMAIDWLGDGIRADIGAKFTFDENRTPLGLAGYFNQTEGRIRFESASIGELAAMLAFGAEENYISGHAALDLSGYSVAGGMFFGRTCDLMPITLIDPDVAKVIGEPRPSFTGAYIYGEGEMPIVDYGCAFNISAGVGAGLFYFVEGPTYGGKMMAKVSGEALCLMSVKGKIEMIGAKRGDDLSFMGKGRVKGKVGWCPVCKRFKKTVTLTYKDREWHADY